MRNTPKHLNPNAMHVKDLWNTHVGEDAFVVGTGSSLEKFDFLRLRGRLTIALNDAVLIPGLDPAFHIFVDEGLWKRYVNVEKTRTIHVCTNRPRQFLFQDARVRFKQRIYQFDHAHAPVMTLDDGLYCRSTVATGGIHMAWKLGARRIFLLGVDGYKREDRYYWDGKQKRPEKRREKKLDDGRIVQDRHENWARDMRLLKKAFVSAGVVLGPWPGFGVYNLNPLSTIDAWDKVPIEEVLRALVDFSRFQKPDMPDDEMAAFVSSIQLAAQVDGSFVEIGVKQAWSTVCLLQTLRALGEARRVLSVDPDPYAMRHYQAATPAVKGACRAKFMLETSGQLGKRIREPIAWLFVDGCHCETCVSEDLRLFAPRVVPGGVVVVHDTSPYVERHRQTACRRTGRREPVRAGMAARTSPALKESFALVEAIEDGRRSGIRVYRRVS